MAAFTCLKVDREMIEATLNHLKLNFKLVTYIIYHFNYLRLSFFIYNIFFYFLKKFNEEFFDFHYA